MEATAPSLSRARTALESGDPSRAIRHVNALLRDDATAEQLIQAADFVRTLDPRLTRRLAMRVLDEHKQHAMALHLLAESMARLGKPGPAHEIFRDAVKHDGRIARLRALRQGLLDEQVSAHAWIGRFEDVGCPACDEVAGTPVWSGNLSEVHECHGVIDPVRMWVRCVGCGLVRVTSPAPPATIEAWLRLNASESVRPPTPSALSSAVRTHDRVIERIRDEGYGLGWVERGGRAPRLLDLSVTWGTFLAAADWRGFDAIGLSRNRTAARWAQQKLGVKVESADIPADLPEGPFDVVTMWGLLDRVEDPGTILDEVADRIEDGGLLALSTPSLDHPAHRAQGYDDVWWRHPERRVWYDRETLAMALLKAGLQPVRSWHDHREIGSIVVLARKGEG